MSNEKMRTRHLITSEKNVSNPGNRIVGSAFQGEDASHMTLHLRILPGITFFLALNWSGYPEYIVFSGRAKKDDGTYRFFHGIGSGYKSANENCIEVHLPDLNQAYYIQLDPIDYHCEQQRAA